MEYVLQTDGLKKKYRSFQVKLFPTVDPETVIGVRTPELRSYAKTLLKEEGISTFLSDFPHNHEGR